MTKFSLVLICAVLALTAGSAFAAPDLVPTALTIPASANPGANIPVNWSVQNQGTTATSGGWVDRLYLSTDNVFDGSDSFLGGDTQFAPLNPGDTRNAGGSVNLPVVPSGNYFVILVTDADGNVAEANETNNTLAMPITITRPDLVPTLFTAPSSAVAGQGISISWTVKNQGNGSAGPSWNDQIYFSTDTVLDGGDTFLGNDPIGGPLAAGASYNAGGSVTIPNVAPGNYYLLLATDPGNGVIESDETNNVLPSAITVTRPDLVPTVFTAPPSAAAGASIPVSWTVENQGNGPANGSWGDQIYFSTDNVLDGGDQFLGNDTIGGPLAAGASYNAGGSVSVPNVGAGNYFLIMVTDAGGGVVESNENNNALAIPFSVVVPTSTATLTATATLTVSATPTPTATDTATGTPADTATPTATPTSALAVCASAPRNDCDSAGLSLLKITDDADPTKRKLTWKWLLGSIAPVDLGDPESATTNYALCIYDDGVLRMSPKVQFGGQCSGDKPCWKATATGFQFKDKFSNSDGLMKIKLKTGTGNAIIGVKGKGNNLTSPFPISDATAVTVQFVRNPGATVECWEAVFPAAATLNTASKFKDKIP